MERDPFLDVILYPFEIRVRHFFWACSAINGGNLCAEVFNEIECGVSGAGTKFEDVLALRNVFEKWLGVHFLFSALVVKECAEFIAILGIFVNYGGQYFLAGRQD